ncbi:MAG: class F sortase [Peptococcaceae bacterium]|nr:class F sortase [Peptococcaceae bacterium]
MRKLVVAVITVMVLLALVACNKASHANPPEWSYELSGDKVILTDHANPKSENIELPCDGAVFTEDNKDYFIKFMDLNYDDVTDVAILRSQNVYNTYYDYWLFDQKTRQFSLSEELSALSNAEFEADTQLIYANETMESGIWVKSQYTYENNQLTLIYSENHGNDGTAIPVRMRIPALALDYPMQGTGATRTGAMEIVPALTIVSWYKSGPIPGNPGNAILGGHNMWGGVRSQLFTLDELEIGDVMEIDYADDTSLRFMLESVFVYAMATVPADLILDMQGEARVTLITCKPPFNPSTGTSDNRIVATFKEERVFVIPDPPIEPFPPRTR